MKLERLNDEQIAPLLVESEHAFLPAKNAPNETATSLIKKFKSDANFNVFGYIVDNRAVAYIMALSGRKEDEVAIGPIYVTKNSRGKGLGKQQVADFIQLFAEKNFKSIYTKTWLRNATSRHCFESLGFFEIGRKDNDRIDGDTTISFALSLLHRK